MWRSLRCINMNLLNSKANPRDSLDCNLSFLEFLQNLTFKEKLLDLYFNLGQISLHSEPVFVMYQCLVCNSGNIEPGETINRSIKTSLLPTSVLKWLICHIGYWYIRLFYTYIYINIINCVKLFKSYKIFLINWLWRLSCEVSTTHLKLQKNL